MTITEESLQQVDRHWAVLALTEAKRLRAFEVAKFKLLRSSIGRQMEVNFSDHAEDDSTIKNVALAYETAAIEGLESLLNFSTEPQVEQMRSQALSAAFRAYELLRVLAIPEESEARIFHVLHLSALAYCGEQWTDLRRWFKSKAEYFIFPTIEDSPWDQRVLYRLFECWVRLLRKNGWEDLERIHEVVAGLRRDQGQFENQVLTNDNPERTRAMAFRLIALYHLAKATEILAVYMLQGEPPAVEVELDRHFEAAIKSAINTNDIPLDVILHWLHVTSRRMVRGSIWKLAESNTRVNRFVANATRNRSMFELLPPQRAALQEQGLLDQANKAVVVELPTSGGKTTLAEFRILQALSQFDADRGWVAYVAPTRALVTQLTRRLREDFSPLGIKVEQLSGAIEVDAIEENLLAATEDSFDVLIATPEKLHFVIRNKKVNRPLALVVMDEAQNIEDLERGLRIELLLATIKRECSVAKFLLLMPFVPNAQDLASWLGDDRGRTISMGTSAWQPNERVVGVFRAVPGSDCKADWNMQFETLSTTPKALSVGGDHKISQQRPINMSFAKAKGQWSAQAGAMAKVFSERGTSIAIAGTIPHVWAMARLVVKDMKKLEPVPDEIALVQRFLQTEISSQFELIDMLGRGVGVHHAGLSDETRTLIEWLAEIGKLKVLCATTTLAQGINFPVSSVFLSTYAYPFGQEMPTRSFWNLAGRAGRIYQESVGVVGIAAGKDVNEVKQFISKQTGALVSRLIELLNEIDRNGRLHQLASIIHEDQWSDFRCYVAHLVNEKREIDAVLSETQNLLRCTYGFKALRGDNTERARVKADALLEATENYARKLIKNIGSVALADATGFAPEGVAKALEGLKNLPKPLEDKDWDPGSLFGDTAVSVFPNFIGIMLRIPEISKSIPQELAGEGLSHQRIAEITSAWVTGESIEGIANKFFGGELTTAAITQTCRALYRCLTYTTPWGVSALSKIGIRNFDNLDPELKRRINCLPAMIYHGVNTEAAVLMRMNSVPRSVATVLGEEFERRTGTPAAGQTPGVVRGFLKQLSSDDWQGVIPRDSHMSGSDYQQVWSRLSGEAIGSTA